MRILFMGSCAFSLAVLRVLAEGGMEFVGVFTAPPRAKGRGGKIQKTCIHTYAEAQSWPVMTPTSLRKPEILDVLKTLALDLVIVASYGFILPEKVLAIPRHGCLNVHPSLLPRWRGASPVPFALLMGDVTTGVSVMKMDAGMDTGPLLAQDSFSIPPDLSCANLSETLAKRGGEMLLEVIPNYCAGKLLPYPQHAQGITLTTKLTKEMGILSWDDPAMVQVQKIRALNPWPGTWGMISHAGTQMRVQILQAKAEDRGEIMPEGNPGLLISNKKKWGILCGDQRVLIPIQVKLEGGKPLSAEDFANGFLKGK